MIARFILLVAFLSLTIGSTAASAATDCSTVICSRIKANPALAEKFDERVPVLLTWADSGPLLNANPELKADPRMHRLLDIISRNARHLTLFNHDSCAVVGNSSNLLGSHYGSLIDAQDEVFRMNSAPVAGYEADVGKKNTFHIFNYGTNYQIDGNRGVRIYSPNTMNMLIPLPIQTPGKAYHRIGQYADYKPFFLRLIADQYMQHLPNFVVINPAFVWYVNVKWFTPPDKTNQEAASKGFFVTIMALHMCNKIELFGFGADKNGKWDHYFGQGGYPTIHRAGYQEEFLDMLERLHIITQYK